MLYYRIEKWGTFASDAISNLEEEEKKEDGNFHTNLTLFPLGFAFVLSRFVYTRFSLYREFKSRTWRKSSNFVKLDRVVASNYILWKYSTRIRK